MRVILFGASGMVGQGVLRECLLAVDVTEVLAIGRTKLERTPLGRTEAKLRELRVENFEDFAPVAAELRDYDACFFCLGVSSAGMKEAEYTRVTYGYTMAAAEVLARQSPAMVFVYVSGEGTDSTERGRTMWARVKGRTENALLALPFRAAYMFRPGFIKPMHGVRSRTRVYRLIYAVVTPLFPLLRAVAGNHVTTTEEVGRAMLQVARAGAMERVLGNREIAALGR